jgi:F-type H+-transporting ATPase subunit delta
MSDAQTKEPTTQYDPSQQQLGAIYARALLGATEKAGKTDEVLGEFDSFIADVLDAHPNFETILGSAMISSEDKEGMIDRVVAGRTSPLFTNFLKVVARHGRLDSLRAIHRVAHELCNELRGRIRVEVVTAAPLEARLNTQLADRLRGMLGREPVLATRINPGLIGGIVLRVGDKVYDGSVATQLHRLSGQIITRSVHEIQSRRDSFCHSTGN